jgi:hypothetical protein
MSEPRLAFNRHKNTENSVYSESPENKAVTGAPLDTLAQLRKRAFSKYVTDEIIYPLIDLNSTFKGRYWDTFHCVRILEQNDEGKCTSKYCKHRWCIVCNRIRTAKLIKGYSPVIEGMAEPYMVTLTAPTVSGNNLLDEIERRQKVFRRILDLSRKQKMPIRGIRKLEITYSKGMFHPHFHIVVENKRQADYLLSEWIQRNPNAKKQAQDVSKCDKNTIHELFKYMTKMWSKEKANELLLPYPAEVMDIIFKAMYKKRTVQAFGGIKQVQEEINDEEATIYLEEARNVFWIWQKTAGTWIDFTTGEMRTESALSMVEQTEKKITYLCNNAIQQQT